MKLYHGTSLGSAQKIMRDGFKCGVNRHDKWAEGKESKHGFIYLTTCYAITYGMIAASALGKKWGAVIEVEVRPELLLPDEDFILAALKANGEPEATADDIYLEAWEHLTQTSLDMLGCACARPEHIKPVRFRQFEASKALCVADPALGSTQNHLLMHVYYEKLLQGFMEGGDLLEVGRSLNQHECISEALTKRSVAA